MTANDATAQDILNNKEAVEQTLEGDSGKYDCKITGATDGASVSSVIKVEASGITIEFLTTLIMEVLGFDSPQEAKDRVAATVQATATSADFVQSLKAISPLFSNVTVESLIASETFEVTTVQTGVDKPTSSPTSAPEESSIQAWIMGHIYVPIILGLIILSVPIFVYLYYAHQHEHKVGNYQARLDAVPNQHEGSVHEQEGRSADDESDEFKLKFKTELRNIVDNIYKDPNASTKDTHSMLMALIDSSRMLEPQDIQELLQYAKEVAERSGNAGMSQPPRPHSVGDRGPLQTPLWTPAASLEADLQGRSALSGWSSKEAAVPAVDQASTPVRPKTGAPIGQQQSEADVIPPMADLSEFYELQLVDSASPARRESPAHFSSRNPMSRVSPGTSPLSSSRPPERVPAEESKPPADSAAPARPGIVRLPTIRLSELYDENGQFKGTTAEVKPAAAATAATQDSPKGADDDLDEWDGRPAPRKKQWQDVLKQDDEDEEYFKGGSKKWVSASASARGPPAKEAGSLMGRSGSRITKAEPLVSSSLDGAFSSTSSGAGAALGQAQIEDVIKRYSLMSKQRSRTSGLGDRDSEAGGGGRGADTGVVQLFSAAASGSPATGPVSSRAPTSGFSNLMMDSSDGSPSPPRGRKPRAELSSSEDESGKRTNTVALTFGEGTHTLSYSKPTPKSEPSRFGV